MSEIKYMVAGKTGFNLDIPSELAFSTEPEVTVHFPSRDKIEIL
jgi:hypothetical protein